MKISKILFIVLFSGLLFTSCDRNRVYEEYIKIDDYVWQNKNIVRFEFEIQDTSSLHNVYINVRHATIYPYNNLWLFIKSSSPNGLTNIDTVECVLSDEKGKWLGDGSGDIWDIQIPWKMGVRFPIAGNYIVEYQQAMRVDALPGIMDMGLRIEKKDEK
ncbi:MAG TPA: gliding motility lipoprotein GldH [Bacteroidales bacterium]|nr:gliding motility lipoprotein GldH [Bacteroidales bacterium]